jgi:hypothetical protein
MAAILTPNRGGFAALSVWREGRDYPAVVLQQVTSKIDDVVRFLWNSFNN